MCVISLSLSLSIYIYIYVYINKMLVDEFVWKYESIFMFISSVIVSLLYLFVFLYVFMSLHEISKCMYIYCTYTYLLTNIFLLKSFF